MFLRQRTSQLQPTVFAFHHHHFSFADPLIRNTFQNNIFHYFAHNVHVQSLKSIEHGILHDDHSIKFRLAVIIEWKRRAVHI